MFFFVPNDFKFGHCSCGLSYPGEFFGLGSDAIVPRYLKLRTVSSFLLSMVMSVLMPLVLFVIKRVFSALICMPYAVEAASKVIYQQLLLLSS